MLNCLAQYYTFRCISSISFLKTAVIKRRKEDTFVIDLFIQFHRMLSIVILSYISIQSCLVIVLMQNRSSTVRITGAVWGNPSALEILLWTGRMGLLPDAQIAVCAYAGNGGNVFPATDFKENRLLTIPACRDRLPAVRGKHSQHSRRMHNPQFRVSGKRPMENAFLPWGEDGIVAICFHYSRLSI